MAGVRCRLLFRACGLVVVSVAFVLNLWAAGHHHHVHTSNIITFGSSAVTAPQPDAERTQGPTDPQSPSLALSLASGDPPSTTPGTRTTPYHKVEEGASSQ